MKKIYLLSILTFAILTANAQTTYQRIYQQFGQFQSVRQTFDGGYILSGDSNLMKLDANASVVWCKSFRSPYQKTFNDIEQTSDSGYIATGYISITASNTDIYLVRLNQNGDTLWTKCLGGTFNDYAYSVKQTGDGGFIIAGSSPDIVTGSDAYILKTTASGNIQWTKTFANPHASSNFAASDIQQTNDGGYIFTGSSNYSTYTDILAIKLNSVGDTSWTRGFYQANTSECPIGMSAIQTSDGGYMILGNKADDITTVSSVMIKLNQIGDTSWTTSLVINGGGMSAVASNINTIRQTADGGYVLGGNINQGGFPGGVSKAVLIKTNVTGDTLWTKKYGANSWIYSLDKTADGGYVLAGSTTSSSDASYLIKTDDLGNTDCVLGSPKIYPRYINTVVYKGAILGSGGVENNISTTINNLTFTAVNPCLPDPTICMVTVDDVTAKNKVVWEKNFDTTQVASYNIYKETTTSGVYALAGNVPNNVISTFVDMTSNPAQKADRYEITTVDARGAESFKKSLPHKTIHLNINLGVPPQINLIWDNYEGFTVNTYRIWRGNASGMTLLDSVQGTLTSYSDLTPPSTDSLYFIEVVHTPCNPTAKSYTSTKSNVASSKGPSGIGIVEYSKAKMSVSPNPFRTITTITFNFYVKDAMLIVYNSLGQPVKQITGIAGHSVTLRRDNLPDGLYFIRLTQDNKEIATEKIVVGD